MPRKKAAVTQSGRVSSEEHPILNDDGSVEHGVHTEHDGAPNESVIDDYGNLRELIFLGKIEKIVTIGTYKFKISTINGSQQMSIISKTFMYDENERLSRMRSATLSEAIISVNGVPLEDIADAPNSNDDVMAQKMKVVEGWQTAILNKLFTEYDILAKASSSAMEGDSLKK